MELVSPVAKGSSEEELRKLQTSANEHIMARATCCLQELNLAQHS